MKVEFTDDDVERLKRFYNFHPDTDITVKDLMRAMEERRNSQQPFFQLLGTLAFMRLQD